MHTPLHALFVLLSLSLTAQTPPVPAPATAEEPRVTAPLADDDSRLAPLLTKAKEAVKGSADGAALLANKEFAPLRELALFRKLVRDQAPRGEVHISLPDEPGQALVVRGSVKDKRSKPVADALVYACHTSSKGWYSDRAPHFTGDGGGDFGHARLFCCVRTDQDGSSCCARPARRLSAVGPAAHPPAHRHRQQGGARHRGAV